MLEESQYCFSLRRLGIGFVILVMGLMAIAIAYAAEPEDIQSLRTTIFTSGIGVRNFLNSFLVTMVDKIAERNGKKSWIGDKLNDFHLDYYYGFLIAVSTLNLGAFSLG
ncbi:hypothetical protein KPL71_011238 [Citrus sinensis]|uniref:Uncharacterized protein n=1 Tax=Citrus sinensis TaxID=2711 RepID=A0ACB8L239_CITSI|nr:hypothetical protein KPL71_011238 [Citrus sinensis]